MDSQKFKILFYSDCLFFAGCENMLISLFNSSKVHQNFNITFVYRYSKAYERGLRSRLKLKITEKSFKLPTLDPLFNIVSKLKNSLARNFLKAVIVCTSLKYWFFFYNILRLFFIFKKIKPKILHINNGGYPGAYSCIAAVFAAKLAGVKEIVFVVNNTVVPYNSFSRCMDKSIDNFVRKNVTLFVTGSRDAENKLRSLWNLPERKITSISNTIISRPILEHRESVLKRLGITDEHIILGNIAILEPRKGQRYLIEALAIVKEHFDDFKKIILIIEGIGEEKESLRRLVVNLGLKANVIFLENEKNIFDIINILDVFILSSIEYEDFPNVILEAMSMGKPVVGTRLAGIPEQIDNGINGLIVDPKDSEGLAQAILTLVNDQKKRVDMGINSYDRFNRLFSYEKTVDRYISLYKEIGSIC